MLNLSEEDYKKADEKFNKFYLDKLEELDKNEIKYPKPSNIKISTITFTGKVGDYIMGKFLYDHLPINSDIIYTECGKQYKGNKVKKKAKYTKKEQTQKLDKRKLGRGKPLSNQISIGMKGIVDNHKNPVCLKMFKNGKIQLTGCKTITEGNQLYEKLYNYIKKIPTKFYLNETEYKIEPIKNMIHPKELKLKTEMINATYDLNFEIKQNILEKLLKKKYDNDEIFVTFDACVSSPAVRCYLMNMSIYDERKKKKKQPAIFVYRSGSCNIIVWKMDLLDKAYNFINSFIQENFKKIYNQDILL